METLQQILLLRELDLPLKQIKFLLGNPGLDKNQLLSSQKRMLELKKERLEQMYLGMERNMTDEQKEIFVKEYGSMEAFKKQFLDHSASAEAQKNFAKVVEWYGSKESARAVDTNPDNAKIA